MKSKIGQYLLHKRKEHRLTQKQAAALFNSTAPFDVRTAATDLCKYEKGVNQIPLIKWEKFLKIYEK